MKVRVRMYRQGLGDCFLLTFDLGGDERHMLIDCGTLGAKTTGIKLAEVVADIRTTTKDHLHLVVATHEHWDHLRGFHDLENEFKKIKVDHVWLAWTENPSDTLAQQVAKYKKDLGTALTVASQALTARGASKVSASLGGAVRDLLGFFGDAPVLGAGEFSESVNDAMEFVRTGLGVTPEYHNPGDGPLEKNWLPGFRFYVLGPPRDEKALNDTGDHGSSEFYGLAAGLRAAAAFHSSGKGFAEYARGGEAIEDRAEFERELPFDARFRCEMDSRLVQELFHNSYFAVSEEWRRVDDDWLHIASDLALQLDSATNNTSLALAIERIADGKILLFPADAQEGNWLSWHGDKMQWTVQDANGKTSRVTASDLLARTVFYKAGHHASHNGTAKGKGLELMQQEKELTAFIPVDRAVALTRNPKGSWKMPARPLYCRLLEKCQGRVFRSDLGWADDAKNANNKAVEKEFDGMATAADWAKWRQSQQAAEHVQPSRLYVDYNLN